MIGLPVTLAVVRPRLPRQSPSIDLGIIHDILNCSGGHIEVESDPKWGILRAGAVMRDMPAWIDPDFFVEVPLERTYQTTWDICPPDFRYLVEHGKLPDE